MATFSFEGKSHKRYVYIELPWSEPLKVPLQAGILILAAGTSANPIPKMIIKDISPRALFFRISNLAIAEFGAHLLFVHAEGDSDARSAELLDLIAAYHLPVNPRIAPT